MSLTSIGVFVCCLLLSGGAVLLSLNISAAMGKVEQGNMVVVYLKEDIGTLEAVKIGDAIKAVPNVASAELVPKDVALGDMMSNLGDDGTLLEGLLEENPLPDAYRITVNDLSQFDRDVYTRQIMHQPGGERSQKNNVFSFYFILIMIIVPPILQGKRVFVNDRFF